MIRRLLVANRGEIACRVMATARRMGIATVAVYSDADAGAAHVVMADEAVRVGPAEVAASYLNVNAILAAAKATGADAVHPGYGFLSENPEFVEAVEAAGLIFVGPSAAAIRAMGLKDAAKALMEEAGVPVVPGYHGADQDAARLAVEAKRIGYPVLIKARAGGGGKGMRLVETADEFSAALDGARREAEASFGDGACLVEKFVTHPRHIEIQVFGDAHGNVIHLFERDCSLQRRHQKVIEEAPAPGMTGAVRAAMGRAAVEAAKAIGYEGAGTVEFIVDGSGPLREDGFWFMEMNTRLQVEHPVSEAITGLDFVELQLRVAAGEPLPLTQEELTIDGWAFEARIYAEDAVAGFLPATGRLAHLAFPDGTTFTRGPVRVDSGVRSGDEISAWYDPMIAKLVTHGTTREEALAGLQTALADCEVAGCVTNLSFLAALARHDEFAKGGVDTGLIVRDLDALTAATPLPEEVQAVAALAALGLNGPTGDMLQGWRHWGHGTQVAWFADGQTVPVSFLGAGHYIIQGKTICSLGDHQYEMDGRKFRMMSVVDAANITVFSGGTAFNLTVYDALTATEDETGGDAVIAPMPGVVRAVTATAGTSVSQGDPLMVLEAMKMEHTLMAPRDGVVADVLAMGGDQVSDGQILITLETNDDG